MVYLPMYHVVENKQPWCISAPTGQDRQTRTAVRLFYSIRHCAASYRRIAAAASITPVLCETAAAVAAKTATSAERFQHPKRSDQRTTAAVFYTIAG